MCEPVQLSRKEQDAVLLEIYDLARKHAEEWISAHYREDIVQDVALECLEHLRGGTWATPELGLDRFVELEILNRCVKRRRSRRSGERRDGKYLATITDAPREWMSQELKTEEDRLRDFAAAVRKTLRKGAVRAHLLVRDDHMTYAQAGKQLRVSRERVHERVKEVHRAFRNALPEIGIKAPTSTRGGRPARPMCRRSKRIAPSRSRSDRRPERVDPSRLRGS
jgi:DNA-directed RNA polymerase specialized sigma24 family protein